LTAEPPPFAIEEIAKGNFVHYDRPMGR